MHYVCATWTETLDRFEKGEIDLIPDVAYAAERGTKYEFNKVPVLFSWFQVYVPKGRDLRSILDLEGKKVAILERSVQQEALEQISEGFGLKVSLIPAADYPLVLEKVARKEADAAVTNRLHGLKNAKQYGLVETPVIFHYTERFFAASRTASAKVTEAIDRHLSIMKAHPGSLYYQTSQKWVPKEQGLQVPKWVHVLVIVVVVLLAAALAGNILLRRQVNARTRELVQINREMEKRIEQRTAELCAAMEKAQEADRLKSAFLATMSHELRTPLNSIIGFTGILLQGLAGPLNQEQTKQLSMVQESARHLLALINDVLDISKIEAGQLSLAIRSVELKPSIEKCVQMVAPLAEKKGLKIVMDLPEKSGRVMADERRLEQVMLNLLNNAVKFTGKGEIFVSCRSDENEYVFSVSDTGIGIRASETGKIFEPFQQSDIGISRKYEGTGLGLAISKRLAEMMGGSISVESRLGRGSVFTVRIPRDQENG